MGGLIMISDKDRAVVAQMCRTGMELEVLKKSFPQFDVEDIEKIYADCNKETEDNSFEINISCNCS